jgi:hypothetical protein
MFESAGSTKTDFEFNLTDCLMHNSNTVNSGCSLTSPVNLELRPAGVAHSRLGVTRGSDADSLLANHWFSVAQLASRRIAASVCVPGSALQMYSDRPLSPSSCMASNSKWSSPTTGWRKCLTR